ncbi:hypothetical protein TWF970_008278 [Orbilia oligospora]|uniref:Uncharacterized protein n=1 Tax=Orbilia oligospora TaxID=2813651 RepID=A0A7C8RBN9_ORBOL|nr:hypothetical protein TWF970_008278 [Orbilia oligospora]
MHAMESQGRRKAPARKRKDDLLRDLFGEENPDLPSPQDRWINIQAVVREVYKELGREYGFIDKRWTEITPRWKIDLSNEVLSRLAEPDRRVLEYRPDVVERLLKDHVSNRGDWKKEKARKMVQQAERGSPPSERMSPQDTGRLSPYEERMEYEFATPRSGSHQSLQASLPPLSSFVEGVERMRGSRADTRQVYEETRAQKSAGFGY